MKAALVEHNQLADLIAKYMTEYMTIIVGDGGKYGFCVMCGEPAEHFCKITKASLCGIECKKTHIELAER
jgi:hypothetical protein